MMARLADGRRVRLHVPWGARKAGYLGIAAILAKCVTKRYKFRRDISPFFLLGRYTLQGNFAAIFRGIFFLGLHVTTHSPYSSPKPR